MMRTDKMHDTKLNYYVAYKFTFNTNLTKNPIKLPVVDRN